MQRPHFIVESGASRASFETVVSLAGVMVPKSPSSKRIGVVLVDEHPVVFAGVESFLHSGTSARVISKATRLDEAVVAARSGDVVVMDLQPIPEAVHQFRAEQPDARVVLFTATEDEDSILRAIEAGAQGFVSKTADPDELLRAIEIVHAGANYFSSPASQILEREAARERARKNVKLTRRELDVLIEVAKGRTSKEIADRLRLKIGTVETHRQRVMKKLDLDTTARLTRYAYANGIVRV